MTIKIRVKGAVQGVGFRPFIAETATKYGIKGSVKNIGAAVDILAIGNKEVLDLFIDSIRKEYPAGALILDLSVEEITDYDGGSFSEFAIVQSDEIDLSSELPVLLPDIGICDECMSEMLDEKDRRYRYPLISCAVCGPRISILNKLPYDRDTTTMIDFEMCGDCDSEYHRGRRRHAQTISCHSCGPQMIFKGLEDDRENDDYYKEAAVDKSIEVLAKGGIIGLKGISGYQLVCLPTTEAATKLRELKGREKKPFAIMFSQITDIADYCYVNDKERELLVSSARPIVLLQKKKDFPNQVCRDSRYIGAFLPSSGIHRLLCDRLGPLIVTSANKSDQPMIYSDEKFFETFLDENSELRADGVLYHKRKINIAQDDSVMFVIRTSGGFHSQFIRRARGYFPLPVLLKADNNINNKTAILATGADLKNTFAFAKNDRVIPSQHLGDLADADVYEEYRELISYYLKLFHFSYDRIICDKHPGYFSAGYARRLLKTIDKGDDSLIEVQHHHAHILSVMAENSLESCIGISFDGTGYGYDGKVWGGEYFYCNKVDVKRYGHMSYVKLCGGDMAPKKADLVRDCYRMAAFERGGTDPDANYVPDIIKSALDNNINTYETSSVGRLFDAVSSLLGICDYNSFEGECATALEKEAWKYTGIDRPEFELKVYRDEKGSILTDQTDFFRQIEECQREGRYDTVLCAYAFHVAITTAIKNVCDIISAETGEKKICLSGGVFMNRLLLSKTINLLTISGYDVYWNRQVPANDAGISLGQAYYGLMLT